MKAWKQSNTSYQQFQLRSTAKAFTLCIFGSIEVFNVAFLVLKGKITKIM